MIASQRTNNKTQRMKSFLALMSLLFAFPSLLAQDAPAARHNVRVLALGDHPPYRHELKDGVMQEIEAPEGSNPPKEIIIGAALPAKGKAPQATMFRLGQVSNSQECLVGEDSIIPIKKGDASPWFSVKVPTTRNASIVMVIRKGATWDEVTPVVFPDDATVRKAGATLITNMTGQPMFLTIGSQKIRLNSLKSYEVTLSADKPQMNLAIQYMNKSGKLEDAFSNQIAQQNTSHQRLIIYPADSENPRTPVNVITLIDPIQQVAPQ